MAYIAAILSGVLTCFSFPFVLGNFEFLHGGFLGWISLVPLFYAIHDKPPSQAFRISFVSSTIWYLGSLFWVYNSMHNYGGMNSVASAGSTLLLVLIVSIYISAFIALARWIATKFGGPNLLWLPFCWTVAEWARNYMPCNGFPWANVALSQWQNLPIIQLASATGVYGVIFLVILVNEYVASSIKFILTSLRVPKRQTIATALIVMIALSYGYSRLYKPISVTRDAVLAGAIQPNISQDKKWHPQYRPTLLKKFFRLTKMLSLGGSKMIVWPESSLQEAILASATELPLLKGSVPKDVNIVAGLIEQESSAEDAPSYNSIISFDYNGRILGKYRKTHLVPFGEYVPYEKILFFVSELAGGITAGEKLNTIDAAGMKIGPLVCYEDIFPEISRKLVGLGAQMLVNVTNDAWYDRTSAAYQHMATSAFRAVETDRYLIRSANTGISAVISPRGQIMTKTPMFEEAVIAAPVFAQDTKTFFVKHGEWFPAACLAICLIGVIATLIKMYLPKLRRNNK